MTLVTMNRITISRLTISIVIGAVLVMGALMYGATKPLADQAFAATPCSLTVGTPPDEVVPGSLVGKLTCGGQGIDGATIHSRGLPGGLDESTVTGSDGSYEIGIAPPLSPGQIFYPYVDFYGDDIKHLQAASATTTIDLRAATANTADNSNAGSTAG